MGIRRKVFLVSELDTAEVGFLLGEVHQESDTKSGGFEIRTESNVIDLGQLLNGLRLHDHLSGDHDVKAVFPDDLL